MQLLGVGRRAVGVALARRGTRLAHARSRRSTHVDKVQVLPDSIVVTFEDGHAGVYHPRWLRVNCKDNVHQTGQKISTPSDLRAVSATSANVEKPTGGKNGAGDAESTKASLRVNWNDGHVSNFSGAWLRDHDSSVSTVIEKTQSTWPEPLRAWESIPRVHFTQLMESDEGIFRLLSKINAAGLCIVDGCGEESGTVAEIASRISPLSHSMLYGNTHDVFTKADPRNIAYTSEHLRLHQDLSYYESPPGLQLMHCLKFDSTVEGGESMYLDGFAAAKEFRKRHPDEFHSLTTIPATFQKVRSPVQRRDVLHSGDVVSDSSLDDAADRSGACFIFQRHHMEVNQDGEIIGVFWSPMFEGVLGVPTADMPSYYSAYDAFQEFITDSDFAKEHTVRRRLKPGDCVVFNNRRMLHGREAFTGTGQRHMQGCYCNVDEALSRFLVLQGLLKDERMVVKRWGNNSIPTS
jgi:alpha-ketoglutarate-dependent taurine dioxygenase